MIFSRKDLELFCLMAKGSKLAAKLTELVGLLGNLGSEKLAGFFGRETWFFENS